MKEQEETTKEGIKSTRKNSVIDLIIPFQRLNGLSITSILIILNCGLFLTMCISGVDLINPYGQDLINWGANLKILTLNNQWWRLITSCFIHAGIIHLAMNMVGFLYLSILEPTIGRTQYLITFFLSGISASLTSIWWHNSTISVGASGAIFGLYGVFLSLLVLKDKRFHKGDQENLLFYTSISIVFNLIYGLNGNIDNAAHIGGLLSGICLGIIFYYINKSTHNRRRTFYLIGTTFTFVIALILFFNRIPNPIAQFNSVLSQVINNENIALELYKMPQYSTRDQLIFQVKNRGITYWDKNLGLLNELQDLPDRLNNKVALLKEYSLLRKQVYQLILENLELDSGKNLIKMDSLNTKIEIIKAKLKNNQY